MVGGSAIFFPVRLIHYVYQNSLQVAPHGVWVGHIISCETNTLCIAELSEGCSSWCVGQSYYYL